jgi:hypothetical protein
VSDSSIRGGVALDKERGQREMLTTTTGGGLAARAVTITTTITGRPKITDPKRGKVNPHKSPQLLHYNIQGLGF